MCDLKLFFPRETKKNFLFISCVWGKGEREKKILDNEG